MLQYQLNTEWSSDFVKLFSQVFRPQDYTVCGSNLDSVFKCWVKCVHYKEKVKLQMVCMCPCAIIALKTASEVNLA